MQTLRQEAIQEVKEMLRKENIHTGFGFSFGPLGIIGNFQTQPDNRPQNLPFTICHHVEQRINLDGYEFRIGPKDLFNEDVVGKHILKKSSEFIKAKSEFPEVWQEAVQKLAWKY